MKNEIIHEKRKPIHVCVRNPMDIPRISNYVVLKRNNFQLNIVTKTIVWLKRQIKRYSNLKEV